MFNLLKNCLNGCARALSLTGTPARMVYFEGEATDAIASAAKTEMQEQEKKVESEIKGSGVSADIAMKNAYEQIDKAAISAISKLEGVKTKIVNVDSYRSEIESAKKEVVAKIEGNKALYEKMAAFVKKRAGVELMLEQNTAAFEASKTATGIDTLISFSMGVDGLKDQIGEINGMDAPGMEKDEAALIGKIEDLKGIYENRIVEIRRLQVEKISSLDDVAANVDGLLKNGAVPRLEDIRVLNDHVAYLNKSASQLEEAGAGGGLAALMRDKEASLSNTAIAAQTAFEKYAAGELPEYGKLQKEIDVLFQNQSKANENLANVKNNPNASIAEKNAAQSWADGAEQALNKKMAERADLENIADNKLAVSPPETEKPAGGPAGA